MISTEETDEAPDGGYTCLKQFTSPVDFFLFFDESFNKGKQTLYPWQVEELELLSSAKPTAKEPLQHALCAANGSGKDAFVITPFAMWFITCKVKSLVLITSSSGVQLTNQTEKYLVQLAQKINLFTLAHLKKAIIKIRKRRITCTLSGSEIMLFATDEGSKAEGYHPPEPDSEMAIIVNEAKSVTPEIFDALERCTGFNYWLDVSSPGEPFGKFFDHYENWPSKRRVTYYDCQGHQSRAQFEMDKRIRGEHDPLFRSKWLALFTQIGGKHVVDSVKLGKLRSLAKGFYIKHLKLDGQVRIGLDIALSQNGDESVISAFLGNKQIKLNWTRVQDATILAEWFQSEMLKLNITKKHEYIYADDGGVGRAVIDILKRHGWVNIKRVLNQSKAKDTRSYRNRGAELWYKFKKLVENQAVILIDDDLLYKQITSRKFKDTDQAIEKITLESKASMISQGLPSPDRADATVLCFTDLKLEDFLDKFHQTVDTNTTKLSAQEEYRILAREVLMQAQRMSDGPRKRAYGSLNALTHVSRNIPKYESR